MLDYPYFEKHYKLIAIDLIKQKVVDTDLKETEQIYFTEKLDREPTVFFIIEEAKEIDVRSKNTCLLPSSTFQFLLLLFWFLILSELRVLQQYYKFVQ